MAYPIPLNTAHTSIEIKKSHFYGYASYASSREQALQFLNEIKNKYPDARHHCWAYLFGQPTSPTSAAMDDDGEPSGTAGKPILNVLQHKGVGDVVLIVVRYFGGIKLGAGGLVRAYSACAQQTMEALETVQQVVESVAIITTGFKQEQVFRHYLSQNKGRVKECIYTNEVALTVSLPTDNLGALIALAANLKASIKTDPD